MARAPSQSGLFGGGSAPRAYAAPGKFSAKPNGYAAPPGTGPENATCAGCAHCRQRSVHGKNFYKCALMAAAWTRERVTDIVLRSPACRMFQAGTPHTTTVIPTGGRD